MTKINFSDLVEKKQEEFISVLKAESNLIYADYRNCDAKRHMKLIGWYYKIKADKLFRQWRNWEDYIADIQVNQDKIIAYGVW